MYNRTKELYCDANIFVFVIFYCLLAQKNGDWTIAQGCRLSPTIDFY